MDALEHLVLTPPQPEFAPRASGWGRFIADFRRGKVCAFCGKDNDLEGHHILPFHLKPELELSPSNILILCRWCHFVVGHLGNWTTFNPLVLLLVELVEIDVCAVAKHGRPTEKSVQQLLARRPFSTMGITFQDLFAVAEASRGQQTLS
jgi:hypothetical protein